MSTTPMTISGTVLADEGGQLTRRSVTGQAKLAKIAGAGRVSHIELSPATCLPPRQALDAIELTDWIILGPGSWYSPRCCRIFYWKNNVLHCASQQPNGASS